VRQNNLYFLKGNLDVLKTTFFVISSVVRNLPNAKTSKGKRDVLYFGQRSTTNGQRNFCQLSSLTLAFLKSAIAEKSYLS